MNARELMAALENVPKDAEIVVGDKIVNAIEFENGRMKKGYLHDEWLPLEHGKQEAVRFTILRELSDGSIAALKL